VSDDRFKDPPPPVAPCRRWVAPPKPDYVSIDEIDAFIEEHARRFQCGKYRPKAKTQDQIPLRDRGDGRFEADTTPDD